jgi:hypothetical protein
MTSTQVITLLLTWSCRPLFGNDSAQGRPVGLVATRNRQLVKDQNDLRCIGRAATIGHPLHDVMLGELSSSGRHDGRAYALIPATDSESEDHSGLDGGMGEQHVLDGCRVHVRVGGDGHSGTQDRLCGTNRP